MEEWSETLAIEHPLSVDGRSEPLDNINRGTVLLEWNISRWTSFEAA